MTIGRIVFDPEQYYSVGEYNRCQTLIQKFWKKHREESEIKRLPGSYYYYHLLTTSKGRVELRRFFNFMIKISEE